MSPVRKKATSTRHAKAKRAAKRSGRRARAKRAAKASGVPQRAARSVGRAKQKGAGRRARSEARKPQLAVVARPAPKKPRRSPRSASALTEFAGAKAGASPKDLALFGLERARVAVHAAIQGLGAGSADRPIAPGKWSPRQLLLHLAHWDRLIVQKYLEAAAALNQRADLRRSPDTLDEAGLAALDHHDWEGAKRLLQNTYEDLWDAFDSIPDEPADVWSPGHAVGELVREVTDHDRRHADVIKRWRAGAGV
jgi:hypothetical protein